MNCPGLSTCFDGRAGQRHSTLIQPSLMGAQVSVNPFGLGIGRWLPAKVSRLNSDGTVECSYTEHALLPPHMQLESMRSERVHRSKARAVTSQCHCNTSPFATSLTRR